LLESTSAKQLRRAPESHISVPEGSSMTSERGATHADVEAVAEIAAAFRQSGLRVSADQIAGMAAGYQFVRAGLEALRHRLQQTVEPVLTFDSAEACRTTGDGDDSR
jgi:hypothetical protein